MTKTCPGWHQVIENKLQMYPLYCDPDLRIEYCDQNIKK